MLEKCQIFGVEMLKFWCKKTTFTNKKILRKIRYPEQ